MKIVIDAMGSDSCPEPEITATVKATHIYNDEFFLVGPENLLKTRLNNHKFNPNKLHIIDAQDTITMEDKGLQLVLKAKRKSSKTSMAIGIDQLKNGKADAFITAGNTGGALATAFFRLGVISGLERPGLAGLFPTNNNISIVIDIGANPDCKPITLLQFAIMGNEYAKKIRGTPSPRTGILSNGEEGGKGNELTRDTFILLENSGLNFIGNVEPKELYNGEADVIVTDGFTGNVFLKTSEAVAKLLTSNLKRELMSGFRTKIGALLAKPALDNLKRLLDPTEIGAVPLLGVNGLVFIGHGRSNSKAMESAIRTTRQAVEVDLLSALNNAIKEQINQLKNSESQTE
jgi:glycerol-3-phosphate acyltransferase PlsX